MTSKNVILKDAYENKKTLNLEDFDEENNIQELNMNINSFMSGKQIIEGSNVKLTPLKLFELGIKFIQSIIVHDQHERLNKKNAYFVLNFVDKLQLHMNAMNAIIFPFFLTCSEDSILLSNLQQIKQDENIGNCYKLIYAINHKEEIPHSCRNLQQPLNHCKNIYAPTYNENVTTESALNKQRYLYYEWYMDETFEEINTQWIQHKDSDFLKKSEDIINVDLFTNITKTTILETNYSDALLRHWYYTEMLFLLKLITYTFLGPSAERIDDEILQSIRIAYVTIEETTLAQRMYQEKLLKTYTLLQVLCPSKTNFLKNHIQFRLTQIKEQYLPYKISRLRYDFNNTWERLKQVTFRSRIFQLLDRSYAPSALILFSYYIYSAIPQVPYYLNYITSGITAITALRAIFTKKYTFWSILFPLFSFIAQITGHPVLQVSSFIIGLYNLIFRKNEDNNQLAIFGVAGLIFCVVYRYEIAQTVDLKELLQNYEDTFLDPIIKAWGINDTNESSKMENIVTWVKQILFKNDVSLRNERAIQETVVQVTGLSSLSICTFMLGSTLRDYISNNEDLKSDMKQTITRVRKNGIQLNKTLKSLNELKNMMPTADTKKSKNSNKRAKINAPFTRSDAAKYVNNLPLWNIRYMYIRFAYHTSTKYDIDWDTLIKSSAEQIVDKVFNSFQTNTTLFDLFTTEIHKRNFLIFISSLTQDSLRILSDNWYALSEIECSLLINAFIRLRDDKTDVKSDRLLADLISEKNFSSTVKILRLILEDESKYNIT